MDENEIVMQMQAGDRDAFDRLFEIYKDRLIRMAYLISGNYADSEDIVQDTFIKCFCFRKKLTDPSCFSSWLYQILTRTAWKYCGRKRKEQPVEEVYGENKSDETLLPLEHILLMEEQIHLLKTIEKLEIRQKTVIVLYYYNQLSTREIARIMNCMEGTVKSRLYTARNNLKKVLEEQNSGKEELEWKTKSLIL